MMVTINNQTYTEIEHLSRKIENNTATLSDYYRYEQLLLEAGMPKQSIQKNLQKANLKSWEELIRARSRRGRLKEENKKMSAVGGVVGLAFGLYLAYLLTQE